MGFYNKFLKVFINLPSLLIFIQGAKTARRSAFLIVSALLCHLRFGSYAISRAIFVLGIIGVLKFWPFEQLFLAKQFNFFVKQVSVRATLPDKNNCHTNVCTNVVDIYSLFTTAMKI